MNRFYLSAINTGQSSSSFKRGFICVIICDGVDILCHEQHRLDASFTWQLQGTSDVSESAEALIRTGLIIAPGTQKR